jgi:uracil-DNA glycosylase
MNTTLTVTHSQFNSHAKIGWKKAVTIPALEKLSAEREHLVFMLWGVHAKKFDHELDQRRHLVLKAAHLSPRSVGGFRGCGQFRQSQQVPQQARHWGTCLVTTHFSDSAHSLVAIPVLTI